MADVAVKLSEDAKTAIVNGLTQSIAETSIETMKAQNYHWNVKGMAFGPLHALFQTIYEDHFTAQDDLAERVRALGAHVEGRLSTFLKRSRIEECEGKISDKEMVKKLADDQELLSSTLISLAVLADQHGDLVTNDMAIERSQVHDKFAWILRSHLE
ncbi:MAG: DNA starvation/stationary phase protection protein [Hyphomicrobiales bacterium]|nr:DNA starvation/stationary phase protection protein [Hyphomicrobiales bacterium]